MIKLGAINTLQIIKTVDFGYFLDGDEDGEILLPGDQTEQSYVIDEWIDVFIYLDSEDRIVATTKKPLGMVDQFAFLKVAQVNDVGAFMDWGLPKDVLVSYHEQKTPMEVNEYYLVYIYLDLKSNRITASTRLDRFLDYDNNAFEEGQKVNVFVEKQTDLGFKCIVEHTHWGVLYQNEIFQQLTIGQQLDCFIKKIREDGRIDLCLHKPGYGKIDGISENILAKLKANDGFLLVNDKSTPETISNLFGISKKAFKKAVGGLYKQRIIVFEKGGIQLVK